MITRRIAAPAHLAIIMDGNGRWAARRGRPRWMGHVRGAQTARKIVAHCARCGVEQLTLYAFSSDNWKRPADEVKLLLDLFATQLDRQLPELVSNGIRLSVIGRRDRLPASLVAAIACAEERTFAGTRMHLRVAIDYSSRAAISVAAAQGTLQCSTDISVQRATHVASGNVASVQVASGHVAATPGALSGATILPAVDMVLRTGGERRLSDFLLWESAYAELAFLDVHFPDLTAKDLDTVFADYAARERRFGGVPMQESA